MLTNPLLWLADLGIFASLWVLGVLAVRALIPNSRLPEQMSVGYGLGIGILTWLLFLLSWAGIPLSRFTILAVFLVLLVLTLVARRIAIRRSPASIQTPVEAARGAQRAAEIAGWIALAVFGAFLLFISVGLSYYFWDAAAIWSIKGYGIGLEQSVFAAQRWGSWGITYPLNLPISVSIFFSADHDLLPGSKMLMPGFLLAMLIGLYGLFRKKTLPGWFAWCGVFAVGTIPLLVQYSLMGYANVPYVYYFVMGVISIGIGLADRHLGRILAGALLLALSTWTRLEGLEFWLIAILALAVVWKREMLHRRWLLALVLPVLVIAGSWTLFQTIHHAAPGEETVMVTALTRILHGELHLQASYQVLRFTAYLVIKTRAYGILVPIVIGLSLLLTLCSRQVRKDRLSMSVLASGLLAGSGVMFMYYLTSYDETMGMDLSAWLGTGYDRMLLGPVVLLAAAGVLILWNAFLAPVRR
jgi:hypothetical protein